MAAPLSSSYEKQQLPKFPFRVYDRDQQYKTLAIDRATTVAEICQMAAEKWMASAHRIIFGLYLVKEKNGVQVEKKALKPEDQPGEILYRWKGDGRLKFFFLTKEGLPLPDSAWVRASRQGETMPRPTSPSISEGSTVGSRVSQPSGDSKAPVPMLPTQSPYSSGSAVSASLNTSGTHAEDRASQAKAQAIIGLRERVRHRLETLSGEAMSKLLQNELQSQPSPPQQQSPKAPPQLLTSSSPTKGSPLSGSPASSPAWLPSAVATAPDSISASANPLHTPAAAVPSPPHSPAQQHQLPPLPRQKTLSQQPPPAVAPVNPSNSGARGLSEDFPIEMYATVSVSDLKFGKKIGEGQYGVVSKGTYFDTIVAIKQLLEVEGETYEQTLKYVKRELHALMELRHPNIVQFMGYGLQGRTVFIVTEFIDGGDLHLLLKTTSIELPWHLRIAMLADVARAMCFLHALSWVHRDLKTENLLVDRNGKLKICDLGLARKLNPQKPDVVFARPHAMTVCGTNEFMSPEMILGMPYDKSTDVFSFGVILGEMITRKEPRERDPEVGYQIEWAEFRKLIPMDCPTEAQQLMMRCCLHEPGKRPTFQEILTEFSRLLEVYTNRA